MAITKKEEALARLRDPRPLTRQDVDELIPYLGTIEEGLTWRIFADLTLQNIAAVQKFDRNSSALTWVIAVLTVIMTGATILTAMPLIQSWLAGNH